MAKSQAIVKLKEVHQATSITFSKAKHKKKSSPKMQETKSTAK